MRRSWLGLSLLLCVSWANAQTAARVRPRIDDPAEKANTDLYVRAIRILEARDHDPNHRNDPATPEKNSFKWFAELHNGDEFSTSAFCRHGNELFLPWHRALLLQFERALQQSDPPDTLALRLPYWNWTEEPKWPAIFNEGGPLFFAGRTPGAFGKTYTTAQLRNTIRTTTSWRGFGGVQCSAPPGCTDGDCVVCNADGLPSKYGALESPSHNDMHNWIGGAMFEDTTAGRDYIFWSFHTYIDLLYDCWQETWNNYEHGCPDCPLNMLPGWTPKQVVRAADLGYTYDFRQTPCGPPPPMAAAATAALDAAEYPAAKPAFVDVTIPPHTFATAHIRLSGLENLAQHNYSGEVYLFPAGSAFAPSQQAFRNRYHVGRFAVWGTASEKHAGHGETEVAADVDATTELAYLAKKYAGAKWRIGVVVNTPNPQKAGAAMTPKEALRTITIDDISIVYDRDFAKEDQP
jgi:tyrosinase